MNTEDDKNDLNLRSEEIQDIMHRTPSWIVRWGISSIFILIIIGIFLTYLIEYPEIIQGPVNVTTTDAPVRIVAQSSGNVIQLYVKEGDYVKAGTLLAEIENPTSAGALAYLGNYLTRLENALNSGSKVLPMPDTAGLSLGDLHSLVSSLQSEIVNLNVRKQFGIDETEIAGLAERIKQEQNMLAINDKMLRLAENDLENAKLKFESDKTLFNQGVTSKAEFMQQESNFRNKQMQVEQLRQSKVQNTIALNTMQQQLAQSGYNRVNKDQTGKEAIRSYIQSLRSFMIAWQQRYNLIAPADGKVSYLFHLQTNQFVKAGEPIFGIVQADEKYIAVAHVPTTGMGKVKVGQKVYLQLEHYPYYEYGMVEGLVESIGVLPSGSEYRIEINLPYGMKSTHGKILTYSPEMQGIAEIITEDKRVIERIFDSFIKVFQKR
jgi:HlyD family secretion protein